VAQEGWPSLRREFNSPHQFARCCRGTAAALVTRVERALDQGLRLRSFQKFIGVERGHASGARRVTA